MSNNDVILYVDDRATLGLLRELRLVLGADPAHDPLRGAVYVVRHSATNSDSTARLRERLHNEIDWGDAEGMLLVHDERSDFRTTHAIDVPEYPAPVHGRVVHDGSGLAPGRRYRHPDGRVRTYIYQPGGYEGWEWYEGEPGDVERHRGPVANLPGPWTEHTRHDD